MVQLGVRGDSKMINKENDKLECTNTFVLLGIGFNTKELHNITDINCNYQK